jgi:hypothetical protein
LGRIGGVENKDHIEFLVPFRHWTNAGNSQTARPGIGQERDANLMTRQGKNKKKKDEKRWT